MSTKFLTDTDTDISYKIKDIFLNMKNWELGMHD